MPGFITCFRGDGSSFQQRDVRLTEVPPNAHLVPCRGFAHSLAVFTSPDARVAQGFVAVEDLGFANVTEWMAAQKEG